MTTFVRTGKLCKIVEVWTTNRDERVKRRAVIQLLASGLASALSGCGPKPTDALTANEAMQLYAEPLPAPTGPLSVFHLGHSLVGRDMPAMVAQLAGSGHTFQSQLGWGTSLKNHWDGEINGFAAENDHPAARAASEAIDGGDYDAVVLTEMVEIRDAIRYHNSADYLLRWVRRARAANPGVRVYLYESWPNIDDDEGWLNRVDRDLARHWEDDILVPAVRANAAPIYVIPCGQALAGTVRDVMARGGVDGVTRVEDFFAQNADGSQDTIHVNDLGCYVVAVTHYAVLYHANPIGCDRALKRADGTPAMPPGPDLARLIQEAAWDVVTRYNKTGLAA